MASIPTTTGPVKVLTVGPAVGAISELFTKIKSINDKHGPFDLAICTGDFFGPPRSEEPKVDVNLEDDVDKLLDGKLEGEYALPQRVIEKIQKAGGALSKNVFVLQKYSVMTTAQGLRIACLGGTYDAMQYASDLPQDFTCPYFTKITVDKLLSNTNTSSSKTQNYSSLGAIKNSQLIDIFLTNIWPSSITHSSAAPLPSPELSSIGAPPLDEIVRTTKPKYIFSSGGGKPPKFWEREPFTWEAEEGRSTRFISLGAFGGEAVNGKKQRRYVQVSITQWFYAFSIAPPSLDAPPPARPTNATANPFANARPPKRSIDDAEPENFIWGNVNQPGKKQRHNAAGEKKPRPGYKCRKCESTEPGHYIRDCPTKNDVGDTGGKKPRNGYVCRACASTEHYIEDCPVAKAGPKEVGRRGKRGRATEIGRQIIPTHTGKSYNDVPTIPGGGHVLIIPIAHYPTLSSISKELRGPVLLEIEKYKLALRTLYAQHGAGAVFVEVARLSAKGGHAHIQVVPVSTNLQDRVEEAFTREGKAHKIEFESNPEGALKSISEDHNKSYFRVDLPDGRTMVHLIPDNLPFSIQFGRCVAYSETSWSNV
ncbi:hypothetical protein NEOLEDRAFT_1147265 [Neolentinus lepideus HHB14362 ss-1]|uniref:CCHC-type domain-containing protein n=1 Tax=Neolentinus lepideus HHB14362 ss-1 TaxID=1314782 RepID=A0A165TGI9_9AGAM|nr:hypothetical protein NEOLEDRAFT_1147265 [Neolentinus lepideus HHB14362 ss-1]